MDFSAAFRAQNSAETTSTSFFVAFHAPNRSTAFRAHLSERNSAKLGHRISMQLFVHTFLHKTLQNARAPRRARIISAACRAIFMIFLQDFRKDFLQIFMQNFLHTFFLRDT